MRLRRWPPERVALALHVGWALPPVALLLWFGLIDSPELGEGRCASCGLEGYVIAAHVAAGVWLAGVVATAAAARRLLAHGVAAPGPATVAGLIAVGTFAVAGLVWHALFSIPALAAMVASFVVFPAAAIWWVAELVALLRASPAAGFEVRRLSGTLVAAWVSLTLLLPAVLGWVWTDRVEWLVF